MRTASSRVIRPSLTISMAMRRAAVGVACPRCLEHPELALFDGELDIAHIAIMILEGQEHALELLTCRLEARGGLEVGDGLGIADAGDDVLALGVNQKVAVKLLGAVGRVAREGDAGRGGLALIAKGHSLNVDGGAEFVEIPCCLR